MRHLSEVELIELYYGEAAWDLSIHAEDCRDCSMRLDELRQTLDAVDFAQAARRDPDYGDKVWDSLQPRLIAYERRPSAWRAWRLWRAAAAALVFALVVAGAFVGGHYWEKGATKKVNVAIKTAREATQPVVLEVLADHLHRSEWLLVALEHADSSDRAVNAQLQSAAQQLLASNRLYRSTLSNSDDPLLDGVLQQLGGVLVEVANSPNPTPADLQRLRNEMNTEGILFEIRVLMASRPDLAREPNQAEGASI